MRPNTKKAKKYKKYKKYKKKVYLQEDVCEAKYEKYKKYKKRFTCRRMFVRPNTTRQIEKLRNLQENTISFKLINCNL